ncbi:aminotransferase [Parcubacteria bacterium DG_74_2]|nr:MAG: aminotransferase [Parcubacteria bacterium DG_74_2]
MRLKNIVNKNYKKLNYEIREIVFLAKEVEELGQKIIWENIGDPVEKGEKVAEWIKKIVQKSAKENLVYAYSTTKGLENIREFLANLVNKRGKIKISKEEIIFFNGLGDAINKIYNCLQKRARIIMPSPGYPAHFSQEAIHAGKEPIFYALDPKNHWYPDLKDLEKKIKAHPEIVGTLIINPNNPTGVVYPKKYLTEILELAEKYKLFIIADEIYLNLSFAKIKTTPLSDIIGNLPAVSMKGISKEFPWPGSRCGWLEFYNLDRDKNFKDYFEAIFKGELVEVSATTLPQFVIPEIMTNRKYKTLLKERVQNYKKKAEILAETFKNLKEVILVKPEAAFYATIVFKERVLNKNQKLEIKNKKIKRLIEKKTKRKIPLDRRFAYYLLGATGICVVPLTGFYSRYSGFRMTLLEPDLKKFKFICQTLKEKIKEYVRSN